MKEIKDEINKKMDEFKQKLEDIFQEEMKLKPNMNEDNIWQFKIEGQNLGLVLDIWFYNIGETRDYTLNNQKNQEPVIRINWFEVKLKRIGLGTKVYKEFTSILPTKIFKRVLLDSHDESSYQFWSSLGFSEIERTANMYHDLY